MENIVMTRREEGPEFSDSRKLPVMKTLARLHECDAETLVSQVEGSELDVHDILREMLSEKEVEATGPEPEERFSLTLRGWGEYMKVLGSIYELPE